MNMQTVLIVAVAFIVGWKFGPTVMSKVGL